MSATIEKGYTFGSTEQVTNTKLHLLVDNATISGIVNAEISNSAAIADTKLATISTAGKVAETAIGVAWTDYFATSTIVGWEAGKTGHINIKKIGKTVFVNYYIGGTSNSATTTFTVPYTINIEQYHILKSTDNGGAGVAGLGIAGNAGTTITLYKTLDSATWTTSGAKSVTGQFWYESA
jgi:hypothetical protein